MKKIYLKFYTVNLFFILITYSALAQKIQGYLRDQEDKPVSFANVILYGLPDSVFLTGSISDDNGHFEIARAENRVEGYIRVSCIGYETITLTARSNIGVITLKRAVASIGEITINASRPIVRSISGRLLVNVSGTVLSKAGNVFDALRRSPGVLVDNNDKITVFGRGTPVIFLNGREVKNIAEIATLQSNDIVSFEIDRNPSAEYAASGNAIVKITTKRATSDNLNFQLYNYSSVARRYRNVFGTNVNGKSGLTDFAVNYSYSLTNYKNIEEAYENNFQETYTIRNKNSAVRYPSFSTHNLFASVNQTFSSKHTVGAQINLKREDSEGKSHAGQIIERTDRATVNRDINKRSDGGVDLSTYSLNYLFKIDSVRSLSVIGDYSQLTDISSENIGELNLSDQSLLNTLLENRNKSDVYSVMADFETPVFSNLRMSAGGKVSEVNRNGKTVSTNIDNFENNYADSNSISDRIRAVYIKANYHFRSVTFNAGIRYERTATMVSSLQGTLIDSTYSNWFPAVSLSKKFPNRSELTLSYTRKIDRPAFDELSTNVIYFDANSYSVGNPQIRPTIRNNFSVDLSALRNVNLNFGYRMENNPRILTAVNDDENPNIVKYTPVNLDKAQYAFANIDYSLSRKWYGNTVSFGIEKPDMKIPFLGEVRKVEKLNYFFKIDNNFTLSKKVNTFINFVYRSNEEDLMTYYSSRYNLSMGCNTSVINDKLKISLLANDILNTSDTRWEDRYANIVAGSIPDHDNSWIRLILRYNFRNFKKGAEKKIASEDELNRM